MQSNYLMELNNYAKDLRKTRMKVTSRLAQCSWSGRHWQKGRERKTSKSSPPSVPDVVKFKTSEDIYIDLQPLDGHILCPGMVKPRLLSTGVNVPQNEPVRSAKKEHFGVTRLVSLNRPSNSTVRTHFLSFSLILPTCKGNRQRCHE